MRSAILGVIVAFGFVASASAAPSQAIGEHGAKSALPKTEMAFPFISVCTGTYLDNWNLGGVGGGGGGYISRRVTVTYPSMFGCPV
jgi:hypothetical protein